MNSLIKGFIVGFVVVVSGVVLWEVVRLGQGPDPVAPRKVTSPATSAPRTPFPHIVSVNPDAVSASNGNVSVGMLHVSYTIADPERVTKAYLELYNTSARVIARTDIPIQAEGSIDWVAGANANIGPAVRLRADCPTGFTDWVVLGLYQYPASSAQTYINNINPKYIREPYDAFHPEQMTTPSIAQIDVYGVGFQQACKLQASVNNGPTQDLQTFYGGSSHLGGQLPWVGEVGSRDLELKLIIRGPSPTEDIFHIPVKDE